MGLIHLLSQLALFILILPNSAVAQIMPDSTVGTQVTPNVMITGVLSDRIDNGTIRGNNLFHSFSDFNINAVRGVYFTTSADITNIFTRVTGTNPSYINGTLGVLGNANLFFMNPNGIVFGSTAKLDVKGSFLGTSAMSINFADGTLFSASNPQPSALLTVSVPVGLGFGSNSGAITVQGTGHKLTGVNSFAPYILGADSTGLQVQPGKTLALVGGELNLTGGILTAEQGRIELGSVGGMGLVSLHPTAGRFTLSYDGVSNFGDIKLAQQALSNVTGASAGSIQVRGRRVSFSDGSVLWAQNRGTQPGGIISIHATESLELNGYTLDGKMPSSIYSETVGVGAASDIAIASGRVSLRDGSTISSRTFSAATGGNINLNATESVLNDGFLPSSPNIVSSIAAQTLSTGNAGNVTVSTQQLSLFNGANVVSSTFNRGSSGSVIVNAQTVEVVGATPAMFSSALGAGSLGAGIGGNFTLNTRTLSVREGGSVSTSSYGTGSAGSITVNASEWVEVSGNPIGAASPSLIHSTVTPPNASLQRIFRLSAIPSGLAGDVTINTPELKVTDGGTVSVRNEGVGNAGTLQINSRSLVLDNQGSLTAASASGEGGNIVIQAQNLQLRHNSSITTTAGTQSSMGNGGNLTIYADTITQLENSDITANAVQGRGGNININNQGSFRSIDSDITASSELGISGVVNITTPDINQENSLNQQPSNFITTESVVASSCLARRNANLGTFVVTGNGGLPETPNSTLIPYEVVQIRSVAPDTASESAPLNLTTDRWKLGDAIVEAKGLLVNSNGRILLTATASSALSQPQNLTCN